MAIGFGVGACLLLLMRPIFVTTVEQNKNLTTKLVLLQVAHSVKLSQLAETIECSILEEVGCHVGTQVQIFQIA